MMMGVVPPPQKIRHLYNAKYQNTYYNQRNILERDYIKDTIIRRTYSGRKPKETGFCI